MKIKGYNDLAEVARRAAQDKVAKYSPQQARQPGQ